jgi:endonuclease YncB( thermonuclease family)
LETKIKVFKLFLILLSLGILSSASATKTYGSLKVDKVISVYDGDTFRANLNSGHPLISKNIRIRLSGIDTPEIKGKCFREKELAKRARDYLRYRLNMSKNIVLQNIQRGKYFRIVADVILDGKNINQELIDKKMAYSYYKGRKNDWCDSGFGWIKLK